jgi:hypothetical protein
VLTGHDHHYERTDPLDGVTHVVSGAGSRLRGPARATSRPQRRSGCSSWLLRPPPMRSICERSAPAAMSSMISRW